MVCILAALTTLVLLLLALPLGSQQPPTAATTPKVYRLVPVDALSQLITPDPFPEWHSASSPAMVAFKIFVDESGKVKEARVFPTAPEEDLAATQSIVQNLAFHPLSVQSVSVSVASVVAICFDAQVGSVPCAPRLDDQGGVSDPIPQRLRLPGCEDPASWHKCKIAEAMKNGKISGANPRYPQEAKSARIMGAVAVRLVVSAAGDVIATRVLGGPPMLYEASVTALKTWKFKPLTWNGTPVEVEFNEVIHYDLIG